MTESTKINFQHRKIRRLDDITDWVEILFPGNRNQQHAAARILLALKESGDLVPRLSFLEERYGISRRTLERTRAKLARLGLIEHMTWMNSRYHGREGWILSTRMSSSLRSLADTLDQWAEDAEPPRMEKEKSLVNLLGP